MVRSRSKLLYARMRFTTALYSFPGSTPQTAPQLLPSIRDEAFQSHQMIATRISYIRNAKGFERHLAKNVISMQGYKTLHMDYA